jgi:hypothetical protein
LEEFYEKKIDKARETELNALAACNKVRSLSKIAFKNAELFLFCATMVSYAYNAQVLEFERFYPLVPALHALVCGLTLANMMLRRFAHFSIANAAIAELFTPKK